MGAANTVTILIPCIISTNVGTAVTCLACVDMLKLRTRDVRSTDLKELLSLSDGPMPITEEGQYCQGRLLGRHSI